MTSPSVRRRIIRGIRLLARIWSALLLGLALLMLFAVDSSLLGREQATDWLLIGIFPGLTLLGLVIAWRWEALGGLIALASFFLRLAVFLGVRGQFPSISASLLQALLFVTPGLLFMWCASLSRREARMAEEQT